MDVLDDATFRAQLADLLVRTGLSQRGLSAAFGRDPGYVQALLDPTRPSRARPTPDDLLRAADATGLTLVELLEQLWGSSLAASPARPPGWAWAARSARHGARCPINNAARSPTMSSSWRHGAEAQAGPGEAHSPHRPAWVRRRRMRLAPADAPGASRGGLGRPAVPANRGGASGSNHWLGVGSRTTGAPEIGAVDGGVDLVVVGSVGEGDELVLVVGEPRRRAQVEDLARLVARGERASPGDLVAIGRIATAGRFVRLSTSRTKTCLEGAGLDVDAGRAARPERRRPVAPAKPGGQAPERPEQRGPTRLAVDGLDADSSESVRPVSQRRCPSASCARQAPTR